VRVHSFGRHQDNVSWQIVQGLSRVQAHLRLAWRAAHMAWKASRVRGNGPGPRPIRSHIWGKGFPWLSRSIRRIVAEANSFVLRTLEACEAACSAGGHFLLEHPGNLGITRAGLRPGSIWDWPETRELQVDTHAFTWAVFQCEFGAPTFQANTFPFFSSVCRIVTLPRLAAPQSRWGLQRPAATYMPTGSTCPPP
jgi:hypothetical protein